MKSWNWIRKLLLGIGTSLLMGKNCFYITTKVLTPYAKTWKKIMNICALWEMFQDKIDLIKQSHQIIATISYILTGNASAIQPLQSSVSTNWFRTTRITTKWSNRRYCSGITAETVCLYGLIYFCIIWLIYFQQRWQALEEKTHYSWLQEWNDSELQALSTGRLSW